MIFTNLNIVVFIKQYLGVLYGKLNHLFIALMWPLVELFDTYNTWRVEMNYLTNISSQAISIAGNLNKKFDTLQSRITISDGNFDPMLYFPLDATEGNENFFPLDAAEGIEVGIVLNEFERVGDVDFVVNIPSSINALDQEIKGAINAQKLAGKLFQIIYI